MNSAPSCWTAVRGCSSESEDRQERRGRGCDRRRHVAVSCCPLPDDVIATLNLNGDYLSDARRPRQLSASRPAPTLSDSVAMFEATHGTAPKLRTAGQGQPGSLILSAEMMLRHGLDRAADLIIKEHQRGDRRQDRDL